MTHVSKVVIAGPFGAGKTTFVTTACADALGLERAVSDDTSRLKEQTTVALDHGTMRVAVHDEQRLVTLFGTPGQERFNFMWPILGYGMSGYIVVVDASRLQSQAQARGSLKRFQSFAPEVPYTVAANRWDSSVLSAAELAHNLSIPQEALIACDPRVAAETEYVVADLLERASQSPHPDKHAVNPGGPL